MQLFKTEGFILSNLKFRDYDEIITLFTKEEGIVKIIFKKAYSKKEGYGAKTSPFIQADFIYTKGRSEIFNCQDVHVLNHNYHLRQSYENLQVAASLASALIKSQLPLKPAPLLYTLFATYLKAISSFQNPKTLALSFYLKLLRHEGLFDIPANCSLCHVELIDAHLLGKEAYCHKHQPQESIPLSSKEIQGIYNLAFSRSLKDLQTLVYPPLLESKILALFNYHLTFH